MRKILLTSSFLLISAQAFAQSSADMLSLPGARASSTLPSSMVSPDGSAPPQPLNGAFVPPTGMQVSAPAESVPQMPLPNGMVLPANRQPATQPVQAQVQPRYTQPQIAQAQPMMQVSPAPLPQGGFVSTSGAYIPPPQAPTNLPSVGFIPVDGSSTGTVAGMAPSSGYAPQTTFQPANTPPGQQDSANSAFQAPMAYPGYSPGQQQQNGQQPQMMVPNPVQGYVASGQPIYMTPQDSVPSPGYRMNGLPLPLAPGSPPSVPSAGTEEFNRVMRTLMPMTPAMIRQAKEVVSGTEREISRPVNGAPRPKSKALNLTLKPGEDPPVLHLYPGNATAITFVDVTGEPWPVLDVTSGDSSVMDAHPAGEKGKTNIVIVSPKTNYAQAKNMIVTLVGYPVPIGFQIETGDGSVDYRIDISLRARGPNAAQDIMNVSTLAPTNDRVMGAFIDGVPPREARKLVTSNPEVDAWAYQDMVYVRTPLEVLSPAYVARSNKNVTGIRVYTMTDSPIILVSQGGKLVSVSVTR